MYKQWGSKIESLPRLKDFNDYKLDLIPVANYFAFVINEATDPVYDTDNAYLFTIKENGIFGECMRILILMFRNQG